MVQEYRISKKFNVTLMYSASESLLRHAFIEKYIAVLHSLDLKIIFLKRIGKIYIMFRFV